MENSHASGGSGRPLLAAIAAILALYVAAALAGLPEDPTLEERIPSQIGFLEQERRRKRRAREIRQQLGDADPAADGAEPGLDDETHVGGRSGGTASREQIG